MADFSFEGLLGGINNAFSGGSNYMDEYLTPEQKRAAQRNAMLAASAALLKAGGESTRRIGIGEALGSALEAGQGNYEKSRTGAMTQMAFKQKMDEANRAAELRKRIAGVFTPQTAMPGAAPVDAMLQPAAPMTLPKVGDPYLRRSIIDKPERREDQVPMDQMQQMYTTQADLDALKNYKGPTVQLDPDLLAPVNRPPTAQGMPAPMNPNAAMANQYRQVAKMLAENGQIEQAMKSVDMALKLDPPTTLSDKAKLLRELGLAPTIANLRLLEKPEGPSEKAKLLGELGLAPTVANLRLLDKPDASPSEVRILEATGTPVTLPNVMRLRASGAASTTVNMPPQEKAFETGLGTGQSKQAIDSKIAAQGAATILETNQTGRSILNSGAITGTGANFLVGFNNALKQAGIDAGYADAAANSQAYAAAMGANVGQLIKQFGAGTGLSDADREFAMQMAGGKITLTEQALRKILDINDKAANKVIDTHNRTYGGVKTNIPLTVEKPAGAAPPPPSAASQIPTGAPAAAPAANLNQQRQDANAAIARGAPAAAVRQRFKQNTGQEL